MPDTLTDQLAALWSTSVSRERKRPENNATTATTPGAHATGSLALPPPPKPLRCHLDHHNPDNWRLAADKHRRPGWRKATCRSCGRFHGYLPPAEKPKRKRHP